MMEPRLKDQFAPLERRLRRARLWRKLAVCWGAAAAAGILVLLCQGFLGSSSRLFGVLTLAGAAVAAGILWKRESRRADDFRALAAAVERAHPEVRYLFSAALEQEPDPRSGRFAFLQWRVIDQVIGHSGRAAWEQTLNRNLWHARFTHAGALAGFLAVLLALGYGSVKKQPLLGSWLAQEITVSPGDAEVERGTSVVITARFGRRPPPEATLVLVSTSGIPRRIPLQRQLADPVLGTSLAEVRESAQYHIEYKARKSREYTLAVFDYPELQRADASLAFPEYTRLTNQIVPDTRRISAVEGAQLTWTLQLNKPVARARFLVSPRPLSLVVTSNAAAQLNDFKLVASARYSLELVDREGRTNKVPTEFSIQVLPNRRPELKLVSPRGDTRVSKLEELQLQAQAADDFGLLKYGLGFGVAGQEPQFIELGQSTPAREKRQFGYLISLEKLGVEVDQVIPYFVWADDYGPDGQVRRTCSDVFFAEVRPFEEIYRRDPSAGGGGAGQGGQGNEAVQLTQLQKEIVIATWKLQQQKADNSNTQQP
jgi:hypothetical protein